MERDHALASFVYMTGADEAAARSVLEASNWDLNDAISLHFASQETGGFGAAAAPPAAAASPTAPTATAGALGPCELFRTATALKTSPLVSHSARKLAAASRNPI